MRTSFYFLAIILVWGLTSGCNSRRTARPRTDSGTTMTGDGGGGTDGGGADCRTSGCPTGQTCNTATGVCMPGSSDCRTDGCPTGQTCNTTTGACVPEASDCRTTGCPTGQTCNTTTGLCESSIPCATEVVEVLYGYCDATTVECITSGGDFATCVDADSDPAGCGGCLNQNVISCANDNGCQSDWNQVACCRDDYCGGTLDDPCAMGACASQWMTFSACLETLAPGVCVEHATACGSG